MRKFWIGHEMLGDVIGFVAAAHLYSEKIKQPVEVYFQESRKDILKYFDGVVWVPKEPGMIDCGGDPTIDQWFQETPKMNGVSRFYRFMDPTMKPTKSFDVHFNREKQKTEEKIIGLITHSNTQGDIDDQTLEIMLSDVRKAYPDHKICLIGNTDNKKIPTGVEDWRQEKGNIDWIISIIEKCSLLITPQSGPCFIAAGFRIPMWVYRSKERFWDCVLNYDQYVVERWYERKQFIINPEIGFLNECKKANIDFYENVMKNITSKIVFVHRKDFGNIGDFSSCPSLYFDFPMVDCIDIGDKKAICKYIANGCNFIVGGGGLMYCEEWLNNIKEMILNADTFIWGIGKNSHGGNNKKTNYPEFFKKAKLVGLRDFDQSQYPCVPCVSCMDESFLKPKKAIKDEVVYSHCCHKIDNQSLKNNDFETVGACVDYLSRGRKIITSSYHGAYWGKLLERTVVIKNQFSNKFSGLVK